MIRVTIPEEDWVALAAFVASQPRIPFRVEAAIRAARGSGGHRIVRFRSSDAVNALIVAITSYAVTWEVPWAVPLNRILPRLYMAIGSAGGPGH